MRVKPQQTKPNQGTRWWIGGVCLLPLCLYAQTTQLTAHNDPICGPQAQQQSIEQLLQHVSLCQYSPDWLTHLGERLNAQARYNEAAEHLERALLLQPTHWGASAAYAIALAGSGDLLSATQLLGQLVARPDIPQAQRQALLAVQLRMTEPAQPQTTTTEALDTWVSRSSVAWRMGRDNNLLGTPQLDSLTLTTPNGDLTLPIENGNQPRAGLYQRADARFEASRHSTERRYDVALALQQRRNPSAPTADTQQLEALVETQANQEGIWGNLGWASLHTQGGIRYHSTNVGTGWGWQIGENCQSRLGTELQHRNLSSNRVLSGQYGGMIWTWACTPAAAAPVIAPLHWFWSLRAGTDHPTSDERPGGAQKNIALRASVRWSQWLLEGEWTRTKDRTGYSPLLDNNRIRHSTRRLMRLEYHWSLARWLPNASATVGIEGYVQRSNLRLFDVRSQNTYVSLRYQW
jgi:tetratricopeptide (TPR) repeat protein